MTDSSDAEPQPLPPASVDTAEPIADAGPPPTPAYRNPLRATRLANAWVGIIVFAVVLVLLLIFILQNTESVKISYLGANGHLSLAVAMLLAAVAGVLLTATAGTLRILQLRRRLRRSIHR